MSLVNTYTDICANRHRHNPESQEAFESLRDFVNKQCAEVVAAIVANPGGLTAEEIEDFLGLSRSSVSARCSELRKARLIVPKRISVEPFGEPPIYHRRKNRSGAYAMVLVWNPAKDPRPWLDLLKPELAVETAP